MLRDTCPVAGLRAGCPGEEAPVTTPTPIRSRRRSAMLGMALGCATLLLASAPSAAPTQDGKPAAGRQAKGKRSKGKPPTAAPPKTGVKPSPPSTPAARPAGSPAPASGSHRADRVATFEADWASAPAARYASLDGPSCLTELRQRQIAFTEEATAAGVTTPVRVLDGVGGVVYRTDQSREARAKSPWDVFDCRIVLALDDFSKILRKHDVDEVLIFSGWRPPPKTWPADKPAIRHPGGLAVDMFRFGKWQRAESAPAAPSATPPAPASPPDGAAGTAPPTPPVELPAPKRVWLDVADHFGGQLGSETCGPTARAPSPASPEATELRAIVCEAAGERLFTSMLTPNYNHAHRNHLHVDLAVGARWRIVR